MGYNAMGNVMRFIIVTGLACIIAACNSEPVDTRAQAHRAFETYIEALNRGDTETAASMYDNNEGFHWIERGGVQYESGAEAADSLRALSANGGRSNMSVDNIRVAVLADGAALVSGHFDFTMLSSDGEPQFSFDGWMTVGMVKRAGAWRIAGGQTGPGAGGPQ